MLLVDPTDLTCSASHDHDSVNLDRTMNIHSQHIPRIHMSNDAKKASMVENELHGQHIPRNHISKGANRQNNTATAQPTKTKLQWWQTNYTGNTSRGIHMSDSDGSVYRDKAPMVGMSKGHYGFPFNPQRLANKLRTLMTRFRSGILFVRPAAS